MILHYWPGKDVLSLIHYDSTVLMSLKHLSSNRLHKVNTSIIKNVQVYFLLHSFEQIERRRYFKSLEQKNILLF